MAKFTLKADTKDAQKKLKDLRKEIDKLDKEAAKKREIQMKGSLKKSGIATGGLGLTGAAAVSMGSFVGGLGVSLVTSALSKLAQVIGGTIPLILKFGFGFKNLIGLASKWGKALDVASNAPEHALKSADTLDALDDERRAHGNKTLAEEYAWDTAYKDFAGDAYKNQILQRIENLKNSALGGDAESIKILSELDELQAENARLGPQSDQFGNLWKIGSNLADMSTHELFYRILEIYNKRKGAGDMSTASTLEKLIGARGMGVVGKLGDIGNLTARRDEYINEWNQIFSGLSDEEVKKLSPEERARFAREHEARLLAAADESEKIRGKGRIHTMFIPKNGIDNVTLGAQNEADANRLASKAITDDPKDVWEAAKNEIVADGEKLLQQFRESPIGGFIIDKIVAPMQGFINDNAKIIETALDGAKTAIESSQKAIESLVDLINQYKNRNIEEELKSDQSLTYKGYGKRQAGRWVGFGKEIVNLLDDGSVSDVIKSMYKDVMWGSLKDLNQVAGSQIQKGIFGFSNFTAAPVRKVGGALVDKFSSHQSPTSSQLEKYQKEGIGLKDVRDGVLKIFGLEENTNAIKKMTDAVKENTNKTKQTQPAPTVNSQASSQATFQ